MIANTGLMPPTGFHPDLRRAFMNSPFFNNDQIAIVTITPLDPGVKQQATGPGVQQRQRWAVAVERPLDLSVAA